MSSPRRYRSPRRGATPARQRAASSSGLGIALLLCCVLAGVIAFVAGRDQQGAQQGSSNSAGAQAALTNSEPQPVVLGGPLAALSSGLPNATPVHGGYVYTAHGLSVQLTYDSQLGVDGQSHLTEIIIGPPGVGANWDANQTPAVTQIITGYLPADATHVKDETMPTPLGVRHVCHSDSLAGTFSADALKNPYTEQVYTPGIFMCAMGLDTL